MKLPLEWIQDYVSINVTASELAHKLTMSGLEVEHVYELAPINGIIVGKVEECDKHPNADKLSVCKVNNGSEILQIVCGASNVSAGIKVALATVGTEFSNGSKITKAKLRGVESHGMLCSDKELGISTESNGIKILPDSFTIGANFFTELKSQPILEVAITPNRADCLSMFGLAKEIGAEYKANVKIPEIVLTRPEIDTKEKIKITIEDTNGCNRYIGLYLSNVVVKPSPAWLAKRLTDAGMRPINNIVDITNYVMLETGQPLHAFDYSKIDGGEIIVRSAKEGEKFITIDGKERSLKNFHLLICDAKKPVAIAGIMGGAISEVDDSTTQILLESAYFNPTVIRKGAKNLALSTEASYRFERGVDTNGSLYAINRAAILMAEYANAKVSVNCVDEMPVKIESKIITLRTNRTNNVLGTKLNADEIEQILKRLLFKFSKDALGNFVIIAPTNRPDIEREIDVIEEIARIYGYENITDSTSSKVFLASNSSDTDKYTESIRNTFVGLGFYEVFANSLVDDVAQNKLFGNNKLPETVKLLNPLSSELSAVRNNIVLGLLKIAQYNTNHKNHGINFFEIGNVYFSTNKDTPPNGTTKIGAIISGNRFAKSWHKEEMHNFYSVKGLLDSFLSAIFKKVTYKTPETVFDFFSSECANIFADDIKIGFISGIKKTIKDEYDLKNETYIFELDIEPIINALKEPKKYKPLSKYPPIDRDFAFVLDVSVKSQDVLDTVYSVSPIIENAFWFDVFENDAIGVDKKSMALSVRLRASDKTLTDTEAENISKEIINIVCKNFKANLR